MNATDMPMNLEAMLDGIRFPAAKVEIVNYASEQGATEEALNVLQALPFRNYNNMQEINAELGKVEELPGQGNLWSSQKMKNK